MELAVTLTVQQRAAYVTVEKQHPIIACITLNYEINSVIVYFDEHFITDAGRLVISLFVFVFCFFSQQITFTITVRKKNKEKTKKRKVAAISELQRHPIDLMIHK